MSSDQPVKRYDVDIPVDRVDDVTHIRVSVIPADDYDRDINKALAAIESLGVQNRAYAGSEHAHLDEIAEQAKTIHRLRRVLRDARRLQHGQPESAGGVTKDALENTRE